VSRRDPVQRRSRERVELILKAAGELLAEGGVDMLTMRSLAARADIPVATIYRYFANREELITAYLNHDLEQIDEAVEAAVLALDRVTVRSLTEAVVLTHVRHHQAHPEGIPVWFGGRLNPAVLDIVRELDTRIAVSLRRATGTSGMLKRAPRFSSELVVRLVDRMLEFIFVAERTAEEQEAIALTVVDMITGYLESFATPAGLEGIPVKEFALAPAQPPARAERPSEEASRPKSQT
jgi:AcrR family transcriptional regulator